MAKNVSTTLQFSLGELLATVAMTFLGMSLLSPLMSAAPPVVGALAAITATAFAALIVVRTCEPGPLRLMNLLGGILCGWIAAFGLVVFVKHPEVVVGAGILSLPVFLGLFIGWTRAHSRNLTGAAFTACVLTNTIVVSMLFYIAGALILPSMFRTCGGRRNHDFAAVSACKAYAEAQEIYHRTDYNKDGVLEYAKALDGPESLLHNGVTEIALVDRAMAAAGNPKNKSPKAGYYFKILTAQGKNAPGGAKSYLVNGRMTAGYAIIAYPAAYDSTGRISFMISNDGIVFQADLGPYTEKIVDAILDFDPAPTVWTATG